MESEIKEKAVVGQYKFFDKPYRKEIRIEYGLMGRIKAYAESCGFSTNMAINRIIEAGVTQLEEKGEID